MDRTGDRAFLIFVGFTNVEHGVPGGDVLGSGFGRDLGDLGLSSSQQVTKRCHDRKSINLVGITNRAGRDVVHVVVDLGRHPNNGRSGISVRSDFDLLVEEQPNLQYLGVGVGEAVGGGRWHRPNYLIDLPSC